MASEEIVDEEDSILAKQVDRKNRSLQIVIWMYDHHPDAIVALRRWISDPSIGTQGKLAAAFCAAKAYFGETRLLDLPNIKKVVEERVHEVTFELDRSLYVIASAVAS